MMVTRCAASPVPGAIHARSCAIPSRSPIRTTLSPAASRVPPRGMTMERSCSAATSTTPAGSSSDATGDPTSGDSAPSRYSSSSMRPPTKTPASVAPGARTTRSMCSASLRLRPDDLVDPEVLLQAAGAAGEQILPAREADRPPDAELAREGAADEVHLVEPRRGDEGRAPLDAGATQHVGVGTAAGDEFDVVVREALSDRRIRIDDEDVVGRRESLRERITDVAAADDDDVHPRAATRHVGR